MLRSCARREHTGSFALALHCAEEAFALSLSLGGEKAGMELQAMPEPYPDPADCVCLHVDSNTIWLTCFC